MRITYIAEGSKELGMGHIMHQAAVMERLKWRALEAKKEIVIADVLDLIPEEIDVWNMEGCEKAVLFNCLHPELYRKADIIVTPDVSPGFTNTITRTTCQVHFAGPRYWFLRDEFMDRLWANRMLYHDFPIPIPHAVPPRKIGIMIGGTDCLGLTNTILKELRRFKPNVIQSHRSSTIAGQMAAADLMITGCGLGFWESLAVGTPAIPIAQNEYQAKQYGSVFKLGEVGRLREMIENRE